MQAEDARHLANGKWFKILTDLGGVNPDCLQNKHGPCPLCSDKPDSDRWRWDDRNGDGGGYCNQCGGKQQSGGAISGFDLLMRSKGWDFIEAANEVKRFLGADATDSRPPATKRGKPARIPDKPPEHTPPPPLGRAVLQWPYTELDGSVCYWIQRFEDASKPDKRGKPKKTMVHRTWIDGQWHFPKKSDPFTSEWPSPRPLLGQHELIRRPEAPVLLVEGETTYDAACLLFPNHVVLTWSNGSKAVGHVNWSPLDGRNVTIWPDNDLDGEQCTVKLIGILQAVGANSVSAVNPPEDAPQGWDLADAEDWNAADAATYLAAHLREPELQSSGSDGDGDGPVKPAPNSGSGGPEPASYTMLGFSGDDYYYQPKGSGQVTRLTRGGHTSTNLFGIAPIEYWRKTYPRFNKDGDFTGIDWQQCYSDLLAEQHQVGCYDPSRIRGVGAWWDEGRTVFHLGDRLIVDGTKYPVKEPHPSEYIYQRLPKRIGPGAAEPLTDQDGVNLLSIAEQFHWETPASGMLLAGWVALAPICGALEWRPHIWISAISGSGKTTVFNEFITPLITDVVLKVKGNTTEAGIRQRLKSDALPVMFDEAESNEKADITRIQSVLSLARVASSEGDGDTLKGSASSQAIMFNVRSMFVLSSVNTALKQGADRNRFSLLMLRTPDGLTAEAKAAHWKNLKSDLVQHITKDTGKRLLARMINLIPVVRAAAEVFSRVAAVEFNSARTGDQVGTLLAGAWALQSSEVPTPEQAKAMIHCANWDRHGGQPDESGGDQGDCLQTILQTRLRVEVETFDKFGGGSVTSVNRTISELIDVVEGAADASGIVTIGAAESELGRNGLKIDKDFLVVSNVAKGIKAMLRDTQWHAGGWPNLLASLHGAKRYGVTRFKGLASSTRAVGIPLSLLPQDESGNLELVTVKAAA
jgi:putative DNA primase/helicase